MKQNSFFTFLANKWRENTRFGTLVTAGIIAVIVVFNTVLFGLATKYSWYFYTDATLEHTIGSGTDAYLSEVADKGNVRIIFCDAADKLENDEVYNLVWQTANQFARRHSFVSVENVNIFTDPGAVEKFKYEIDKETGDYVMEDGKRKQINSISRTSVIFESEQDFVVLPMQWFFILDSEQLITSYNGEEVTASMIHRVLTPDARPNAYFTMSHGETYSASFMNRMICAGYNMKSVDLVAEDISYAPGDLVVISNPQFDFIRGNADRGVVGELDKIDAFLAAGGGVIAMLDPLVTNTVKLEEFLSGWGITIERAETEAAKRDSVLIRDANNSVTTDGYALISTPGSEGIAGVIAGEMQASGAGRVIISKASPIRLSSVEGKTSTALLSASGAAESYANGKRTDAAGGYTIAAYSEDAATGGKVFAVGSVFLTAEDALTTNEYGNRDFLFFLLGKMSNISMPTGGTHLLFDDVGVEDLTMWEARLWTIVVAVVLPLAVAATGVVIIVRRRNR